MTLASSTRHTSRGTLRRSFKGVVALLALVVSLATPGLVAAWDPSSFSSPDEALLVQLTNQARAAAGLRALSKERFEKHSCPQVQPRPIALNQLVNTARKHGLRLVRDGEICVSPALMELWHEMQSNLSAGDPLQALTLREREVFQLILAGNTNRKIGEQLGISYRTVEVHRRNTMAKPSAALVFAFSVTVSYTQSPPCGTYLESCSSM